MIQSDEINNENQVLKVIKSRKSVRSYKQHNVDRETLLELVKAGMAAPSAKNYQPWMFIIITIKETIKQISDIIPGSLALPQVDSAILICGTPDVYPPYVNPEFWKLDCSAATQNILLAAESMGLGAVWTAIYPFPGIITGIKELLNIPENVHPFVVIPVGLPTGEDIPKDKFNPDKIKWETL